MSDFIDKINEKRAKLGLPPMTGTETTNTPYTSELGLETGNRAFWAGVGDTLNSMFLGGGGQLLSTLGRIPEKIGWFSGEGIDDLNRRLLHEIGWNDERIDQTFPYTKSWLTQGGEALLAQGAENQDAIRNWELEKLGANPSTGIRSIRGTGSSLAFLLPAIVASIATGGSSFAGAAAMGATEAATESGSVAIDAQRKGLLDKGGLEAANNTFLVNLPLNITLDRIMGPFGTIAGHIKNPVLRWGAKAGTGVLNELIQEPSQEVIQQAANNQMDNGTGFWFNELPESFKQWPEKAWELAPEVAGSTALTHLLMGVLPGSVQGGIAHEYSYNKQLEQGQKDAPQIKSNLDALMQNPGNTALIGDEGTKELKSLQEDMEAVIKNLDTIGYNDYRSLDQNLTHLENVRHTIQNYGESVAEIKLKAIREQQARQAQQTAQQAQLLEQAAALREDPMRQTTVPTAPQEKSDNTVIPAQDPRIKELNDLGTRLSELSGKSLTPDEQQEFNDLVPKYNELYDNVHGYGQLLELVNQLNTAGTNQSEIAAQVEALNKQLYGDSAVDSTVEQKPEEETPIIEETPDIITGAKNNIGHAKTSEGTKIDFRYRVMEASDLITSHKDNYAPNPDYDQRLQRRNRSSYTSQMQIERIANAPDPEMLAQNILVSDGAPVIDKNRMVISGNGRTIGIRKAYKQGSADNYRAWITQNASNFGINAEHVQKMKKPVLVREITSNVEDMVKFASEANVSSISEMAASEKAISNADLITKSDLVDFDFSKDFKAKSNRKFISNIIGKMPQNEQAILLQADGTPSSTGIARVYQALIAKAYNDENILVNLTNTNDTEIPTIAAGLEAAAPQMAKFENSNIRPELSLANDISQAISALKKIKNSKQSVEETNATKDLYSSNETEEIMTDEAKKLLWFFGSRKQNGRLRSAKQIAQGLIKYAEEAMKEAQEGQNTLVDNPVRSKGQILDTVLNEIYEKEAQGIDELAIKRKNRRLSGLMEATAKKEATNTETNEQDITTEKLRQNVEKQLMDVGLSQEEAQATSEVYIKWEENFAKIAGINLEQSLAAENLRFEVHDKIEEKDKAGHLIGDPRARIIIKNGEAILKITKLSDQSSILHEFGHLFLSRILNLAKSGNLKGILRQNWDSLLEAYDVTEQQLAKNSSLFHEVHEKFATDFERYMFTGKAPSKGLKHAFELFKKWLKGIYNSVKDIEYMGADGKLHSQPLSKEARQFFNYMLGNNVENGTPIQSSEILNNGNGEEKTFNHAMSKNATDNRGTFDSNDPEIYNQIIGEKGAEELDNQHSNAQDTDEWGLAFDQASKKIKRKNKEPSLRQKILNYIDEYLFGENITRKERERREALIKSIKSPMKSYQTTEKIQPKQSQTTNEAPNAKETSLSDDLPDISFGQGNEQIEQRYKGAVQGVQKQNIIQRGKQAIKNLLGGFKGSYAELQGKDANGDSLMYTKTRFDQLGRERGKMVNDAMERMIENIKGLNDFQFDLFRRKRMVDDLKWRIEDFEKSGRGTPGLPYGWSREVFEKDYKKITAIAEQDKAVMDAVKAEEKAMIKIALDFVNSANKLGIKLGKRFPNPHYFHHVVLEYAEAAAEAQSQGRRSRTMRNAGVEDFVDAKLRTILNRSWLKKYKGSAKDISANYVQAMGEVRAQMLIDTVTMNALVDIKEHYKDIETKFKEGYKQAIKQEQTELDPETFNQSSNNNEGININDILPDGYTLFSPTMSGLIKGTNNLFENAFIQGFNEVSQQNGVNFNDIFNAEGLNDEETFEQFMVIPTQVADVLNKIVERSNKRESILGHWARKLTSTWKFNVLYNTLRNLKYNIRNMTGDLDALISGLGKDWMPYFSKASNDIWAHLRGEETSPELKDYLDRAGGRMMIQTTMFDDKDLAMQDRFKLKKIDPKDPLYKKAWLHSTNGIKWFMNKEIMLTQYRENLLRYTAYLTFQADMDKNNGVPTRWAASNKDEILAIPDFRQRAYEMANDLLGAYDKISDTGKELRSMLMPFWSWQEVNMKRYYRLLKNGFSGDNTGSLTKRLITAKMAKIPYYSVTAVSTVAKIAVLQAMITAFNWSVFPDDDDELPDDVKHKPHITLGSWGGKVYYFDRIGAMADALDWFGLDAWPLEIKELANGQQSPGQFAKKIVQAPMNKFIGQLNPFLKMPIEVATGRSLYPNAFQSRTITDTGEHIARSWAMEWPYKGIRKLLTGKPFSNAEELMKTFLYSIDPEEAAYFNTLDTVRKFKGRVLDERFEGFVTTKRGTVLRNLKSAIRYKDQAAIQRYLREYKELDGTPQGLKQSMKAMNPLFGMNENEKKQFMRWITPEQRKELARADRYWRKLAGRYIR